MSAPSHVVVLHPADATDLDTLARMNKRLIEDEHSSNPMGVAQLRERMAGWLAGEYQAFLIMYDAEAVGYGLYRPEPVETGRETVYLRQFYVEPAWRRRGIGRAAIQELVERQPARGRCIVLDVLVANPAGRAFWEAVGFLPTYTRMQYSVDRTGG